jgi:tetratricopeptide (TPR) repeat protein
VIVVILAVIVATWWTSESTAQASRAWSQLFAAFDAGNTSALEKVAEDNRQSSAAPAADLIAADIQLIQGCNMLYVNKATANQELNKAAELYQSVRLQSKSSTLRAQATFGLARTRESQGKLEEATQLYKELTTEWPDTVFAKISLQRLEDLKRASTKEIYDQFAKFDPKPVFSQQPGEKPSFDKMPEESPLSTTDSLIEKGIEEKAESKSDTKTETKSEEKTEKPAETTGKPLDSQQSPGTDKSIP